MNIRIEGMFLVAETGGCDFTRHILHPTDFSKNANQAFNYVLEMVARCAKKLH